MPWLSSVLVALLSGVVGLLLSGYVANLAVRWYHVSSFEGGAGYMVVLLALLGGVVGFVVGLIACRTAGAPGGAGFARGAGTALGATLGLIALVGGTARALADVPPTLDGEGLTLLVEVRWPAGVERSPADEPGDAFVHLGALSGHVQRVERVGPLWKEDARREDGRWIVPGAVDVFTERGKRVLRIELSEQDQPGFIVPLPAHPSRAQLQWSDWLPRLAPGAPPTPHGLTYRFRVARERDPVRVEAFGPFEIATMVHSFMETQVNGRRAIDASASFRVAYRGRPVRLGGTVTGVAALPGPRHALLVRTVSEEDDDGRCHLVVDDGAVASVEAVDRCHAVTDAVELTSDAARFRAARTREEWRGRFQRHLLAGAAGPLLFDRALVDPVAHTVRRFDGVAYDGQIPSVPPLALSPDGRSYARFVNADDSGDHYALRVIDVAAESTYALPIDDARMRWARFDDLDPAWVAHHFAWVRGADGVDRLRERPGFTPLPWRGRLSTSENVGYWIEPARDGLREAIVDYLVADLHGERLPPEEYSHKRSVRIAGKVVDVAYGEDSHWVNVDMADDHHADPLLQDIAHRLDAAFATGRYDALFGRGGR